MAVVNLNAAGSIQQVMQNVPVTPAKNDSVKGSFEQVMKEKAGARSESANLKPEEGIKQATRKELKSSENPKAKELSSKKEKEVKTKKTDVSETANEIIEGAAQILKTTPEELKAAMDSLNLGVADLTDRNNVAQLILMLNGSSDISDMLVDNGMLEAFNELNGFIEETLKEAGLTDTDFKAFMEAMSSKTGPGESVLTENIEDVEPKEDRTGDENIGNVVGQATETKGPEVTVTKEESETGAALSGKSEGGTGVNKPSDNPNQVNLAEGFIRNLEMAVEQTGEAENVPDVREIVYQVVERIKVDISPDNTSLEMQLNPENLGRVSINITSKGGVMTAQINTENRQAREAIESQLQILKENIEAKGIRVEAVEVRISDFNFADSKNSDSRSQESQEGGERSGRRNQGSEIGAIEGTDEISEAQRIAREVLVSEGSTVSYTA